LERTIAFGTGLGAESEGGSVPLDADADVVILSAGRRGGVDLPEADRGCGISVGGLGRIFGEGTGIPEGFGEAQRARGDGARRRDGDGEPGVGDDGAGTTNAVATLLGGVANAKVLVLA
jgi:hypothetical protein